MSDHPRFTELTGIAQAEEESRTFWPLNIVLVLLGASILTIAFYFLDPADPRLVYNPWTYAVVTPVALLVLSTALSLVVSRIVEKSMQLAFLLSVIVHLILLVYAMNVIIFSRMWPDILDSIAQERQQLKRQTLQARQYHRVTSTNQTGRRPDYLSFMPTQHQPTELEIADSPSLALARSETANLVSPSPEVERQANPHLMERQRASASTPTNANEAAQLSRSRLSQQLRANSQPEQYATRMNSAPELRASAANTRRSSSAASGAMQQFSPRTPQPSSASQSRLPTRADQQSPSASQLSANTRADIPRSRSSRTMQRQSQIATPLLAEPSAPQPLAARSVDSNVARRSPSQSQATPRALASPTASRSDIRRPQTLARNESQSTMTVPNPTAGDSRQFLRRDTAGGQAGPAAASSMPVQGAELLAGPTATPSEIVTPRPISDRASSRGRSTLAMQQPGVPQAPQWDQAPRLSGGVAGRSPSQIANASSGNAVTNDVADMTGQGRAIERSQVGAFADAGSLSIPVAGVDQPYAEDGTGQPAFAGPSEGGSAVARRSASGSTNGTFAAPWQQSGPTPNSSGASPTAPMLANANSGSGTANDSRASVQGLASRGDGGRNGSRSGPPGSGPIAIPDASLGSDASGSNDQGVETGLAAREAGGSRASRTGRSSSISNRLAIDADDGAGGIARSLAGTALLRRNDSRGSRMTPIDLETQRFARNEVGGPLAAGQKVIVPRPAFQQRLERLKDRNPLDSSSLQPQTELAIERGLEFLAKHQRPNGSWRLQDFDTEVLMRSDTAATGLALLAFQGAGYTHKQFKYADVVDKAINFLKANQSETGDLYIKMDPSSDQNAWLYSHGIAALALCESYGMTQDPELKPVAQSAIDFMVLSQDKERGGWRYRPGTGTDTSVTGWFMMAFKSGQLAGLDVPESTMDRLRGYLQLSQASNADPHLYRYNPFAADTAQQRHGLKPTAVMTSVGLLMRLYFGWERQRPEMQAGAEYLMQYIPENGTRRNSRRDTYYWYYATQVIFHMGGETWEQWHDRLYPLLIESQRTDGEMAGSWDPNEPTPDLWARYGGRLYVTTLNLLSLEVSYRHLPLYDATGFEQ